MTAKEIANKDIDIFILCGGKGRRLRKVSGGLPKPLVKMGDRPFLDILIAYLRRYGFKRFILGTGYRADFIKKYYKARKIPGAEIVFSRESRPLGTGGALKKSKHYIKSGVFFVLNGDSFSEFSPAGLIKFYKKRNAQAVILLKKVRNTKGYGPVTVDRRSMIRSFGKGGQGAPGNLINGGVYLFDKRIFSLLPKKASFSLEDDFFPKMSGKGFYGYKAPGFFIDIGTPRRYFEAQKIFLKKAKDN